MIERTATVDKDVAPFKPSELESTTCALVNAIPVLIWRTSADGSAEFFKRPWLDYTGLSNDEAQGPIWTLAILPDDQDRLREVCHTSLHARLSDKTNIRLA